MIVRFLGQPRSKPDQIGETILAGLKNHDTKFFWAAVAWAKRSGLGRIAAQMRAFRKRGGSSQLIVGVDEGGATEEGLRLAVELFDDVFVFFNPGRTFHPKLYVFESTSSATIVCGSGNLTKGGLFTNFEAAVKVDLDKGLKSDRVFLKEGEDYFDFLKKQKSACKTLSPATIDGILADPRLRIYSEAELVTRRKKAGSKASAGASVFGSGIAGLANAPTSQLPPKERAGDADDNDGILSSPLATESSPSAVAPSGSASGPAGVTGVTPPAIAATSGSPKSAMFWKQLSGFDVSAGSAPGQIIIPIGFQSFFGKLVVTKDEHSTGGVRQSERNFELTFKDGSFAKHVDAARVILYEPAATHARSNVELRFTFRDHDVFSRLSKGDVLVFSEKKGAITVQRMPTGSMGSGRWGWK